MDASSPPPSRLRGWWFLGLICLSLILLTVGVGLWWFFDDGDLADVRAEAKQMNIPTTWAEMNLTVADDARLARWKRISTLSKTLKTYQNGPGAIKDAQAFKPFLPIPDGLRSHHAGMDTATIAELMTLIDQLGDQTLVLRREITFSISLPEIGTQRELLRFLHERVAIADPPEAARLCRRMLALCQNYSADNVISHFVHLSLIEIALTAIVSRLDELKHVDPAIADAVLAATRDLPAKLAHALQGEFLCVLDVMSRRTAFNGLGGPVSDWYMPLVIRAGRRAMLRAQLEAISQFRLRDPTNALAWARAQEAASALAKSGMMTPNRILHGLFDPGYSTSIAMGMRTALRSRLVAAELRGQPWPTDSFDPSGALLRPFTRDGTLVGAYSVDTDGHDDGGDAKKDRYFPLYGPRELPTPAP